MKKLIEGVLNTIIGLLGYFIFILYCFSLIFITDEKSNNNNNCRNNTDSYPFTCFDY